MNLFLEKKCLQVFRLRYGLEGFTNCRIYGNKLQNKPEHDPSTFWEVLEEVTLRFKIFFFLISFLRDCGFTGCGIWKKKLRIRDLKGNFLISFSLWRIRKNFRYYSVTPPLAHWSNGRFWKVVFTHKCSIINSEYLTNIICLYIIQLL